MDGKRVLIYTCSGILFSHKNEEILLFATTWMKLEDIMLNEVSQTKASTLWFLLYMESTTNKKLPQTHRKRGLPEIWWEEEGEFEEGGQKAHTCSCKINKYQGCNVPHFDYS